MKNTQPSSNGSKSNECVSLSPLNFEEALENLLRVKPIDNKTLISKKKNPKPKTKK